MASKDQRRVVDHTSGRLDDAAARYEDLLLKAGRLAMDDASDDEAPYNTSRKAEDALSNISYLYSHRSSRFLPTDGASDEDNENLSINVIPAPRSTKEHVLRGLRGHEDALRNMSTQLNVSSQLLRSDGLSGSMKSSEASVSAAAAGMTEEAYELFRAMEMEVSRVRSEATSRIERAETSLASERAAWAEREAGLRLEIEQLRGSLAAAQSVIEFERRELDAAVRYVEMAGRRRR